MELGSGIFINGGGGEFEWGGYAKWGGGVLEMGGLLTDQSSLPDCLYFLGYWSICVNTESILSQY